MSPATFNSGPWIFIKHHYRILTFSDLRSQKCVCDRCPTLSWNIHRAKVVAAWKNTRKTSYFVSSGTFMVSFHTGKSRFSSFQAKFKMDTLTVIGYLILILIGYKLFFRILRIPRISNLDSRYILITGCDSGFGNATAKRLDCLGCHVIAACFTEKGQTELRKCSSSKLHTVLLDVSREDSVNRAYELVTKSILAPGRGMNLCQQWIDGPSLTSLHKVVKCCECH